MIFQKKKINKCEQKKKCKIIEFPVDFLFINANQIMVFYRFGAKKKKSQQLFKEKIIKQLSIDLTQESMKLQFLTLLNCLCLLPRWKVSLWSQSFLLNKKRKLCATFFSLVVANIYDMIKENYCLNNIGSSAKV